MTAVPISSELPRLLTVQELALVVLLMRQGRKWPQEQLAEISGLTARTVQRVEGGEPSSLSTRRALARAFDAEDIDCFNKPHKPVTAKEARASKEKAERETVTLPVHSATGKKLAELAEAADADLFHAATDLPREAEGVFASLTDCWHDYRDVSNVYTAVSKLAVQDELQSNLDELRRLNFSVRYAQRVVNIQLSSVTSVQNTAWTVAYVMVFPVGKEPQEIQTARTIDFKF